MIVSKPINVGQLATEMTAASQPSVLMLSGNDLRAVDVSGNPQELSAGQQTVVNAHAARRNVTDEEYQAEFQNAATTATRKQEIRDITSGLLPRETVPMT
jgi:hypothetical protein